MTQTKSKQDQILAEIGQIKSTLLKREHLDQDLVEMKKTFDGNGKPGFKDIRDKVMSWNNKINAVVIAVVIDIIIQVVRIGTQ